ncbi:hypothetical protein HanRHA438_Chr02g0056951 [Helianthus annuus]|nr:hypothetical protein HanRHA438_Chr02g0056951 [Helianthus annuus]
MTSPDINDSDVCGDCRLHEIIIIMESKWLKIESMNVDCTGARCGLCAIVGIRWLA